MLNLGTYLSVDNRMAIKNRISTILDCMINRQSHTFSSNLEIIVHAIIKIILGFASYNFDFCLVQLFPKLDSNVWVIITYTNNSYLTTPQKWRALPLYVGGARGRATAPLPPTPMKVYKLSQAN